MTDETVGNQILPTAPILIVVLLIVDSLHFVFARLLHPFLPGETSALYVMAFAFFEIGGYLALRRGIQVRVFRQHFRFFLTIGFLVGASTAFNYIAVGNIDPGTASLLAQMSTIFALGFGLLWLKERLGYLELMGAAVAIIGVFVISFQPTGELFRFSSFLILAGTFMYALHAAVVKRYGGEMDFGNFFLFRVGATAAFLLLFVLLRGQLRSPSEPGAWLILVITGTVDIVVSRMLYYLALRRLNLSYFTILLTLSPVITILWSVALFNERPELQGLLGGAAVILGILIVTASRNRRPRK